MTWLFIDTSDDYLFLAAKRKEEYFHQVSSLKERDFQVVFFTKLHDFLKINGINLKEISKLGVIQGAGAYSTIRVGILFAKTLSVFYNIPLVALGANHFLFTNENKEKMYLVKANDTHYFLYFCSGEQMKKCWLLNLEQVKELIYLEKREAVNYWNFTLKEKKSIDNIRKQNDNKWLHLVGFFTKDLLDRENHFLSWERDIIKLKKNNYKKVMETYFNNQDYLVNPLKLAPWYAQRMSS